ncbi:cytochrome P450 [Aspergillus cavernicola]|uniref:Cytochrome P450 n=1 Tax=Aspergillus cavernicola TaxID=176166 RepID=A0ABR4HWH9_9EURO
MIPFLAVTLAETLLLHHSAFIDASFRTIGLGTAALNLSLLVIYNLFIWPFLFNPLRHLPHPPGKFNAGRVIFDSPRERLPLEWIKTVPNDGLIHFRDLLNRSQLLATNHQALFDVMGTNTYDDFEKPIRARQFLARIIGYGLILAESDHRRQRKALTPWFHMKNIRAFYTLMWDKTNQLLETLQEEIRLHPMEGASPESGWGKVEMCVWASRLTLDIIGPAAMGRDFRSIQNTENKVADSFLAILEPTKEKMAFLAINFLLPQWFARRIPWRLNKVIDNEVGYLRDLCKDIIHGKRAAITATKATATELKTDILGSMMLSGDFTDDELVDQMLTFLAAGHETTASALTWTCYLLTLHPEIQDQLRAEVRAAIPSSAHPVTSSDLESLPLLNGVCQEVLRLYPTVPSTIREAVRDTTVAGKHVPKGTKIILCPYAINRSPEFWGSDGDSFRPERWIDTDPVTGAKSVNNHGGASTNYAMITFLHGQRACIGKDFARAELRCAVAGVVGRFVFMMQDPKQEIHIAGAVTMKPVEGMHLAMRAVGGW